MVASGLPALRVMAIEHWDPQNVYDDASRADAYDPYLQRVGRMLRQGKGPGRDRALPRRGAHEGDALDESETADELFADRVVAWYSLESPLGRSTAGVEQHRREREARRGRRDRGLRQRGGGGRRARPRRRRARSRAAAAAASHRDDDHRERAERAAGDRDDARERVEVILRARHVRPANEPCTGIAAAIPIASPV